jgi:hypothetical protein
VPDHTTLSRRGRGFAARQPRAARHDGVMTAPFTSCSTAPGCNCSVRASGMPRSTAEHAGIGASCISPLMPARARSPLMC